MSFFRMLAYLSPLLVGFGLAAALAFTAGRPAVRRATTGGAVVGGMVLLLLLAAFSESFRAWFAVSVLLVALGIPVSGTYLLLESLKASREACQIGASLVVVLLMGALFYGGALIHEAENSGASGPALYSWITFVLDACPFTVMAYSVFETDLLVRQTFYPMGLAGLLHGVPRWGSTALGYALIGLAFAGAAAGIRRLRGSAAP